MKINGKLHIGGMYVSSSSTQYLTSINPATEEILAEVDIADETDVDAAINIAWSAFENWSEVDASDKGIILYRIADAIEHNSDVISELDCLDSGKPISDALLDVKAAADNFRYFAGMCDKIEGSLLPVSNDKMCITLNQPYGVIGAITAWNYPTFNACAKIAPILATGNSCVLKPAEETPLSALKISEIISNVDGVPAGLVNVLNGPGDTTGRLVSEHARLPHISFTGSTNTGRELLRASARSNIKSLTLELGGKAPVIIFDDSNIPAACNALAFSAFFNQGQTCTAATRALVHESILEVVIENLCSIVSKLTPGDPKDPLTTYGPIVSKQQYEMIRGYIDRTMSSGHQPVATTTALQMPQRGYYIAPHIFTNVPESSELFRDEIFGPVLIINSFKNEQEAIRIANSTKYGLAASLWTKDVFKAHKVSRKLNAGIVWTNTIFSEFPGAPTGGFGESGFGREFGKAAIEEYTQLKTIWFGLDDRFTAW